MQHPDMVHRFFEFLNIESPNNNIHNIRVCRILVATGGVSSRTLSDLQIPSKARRPARLNCTRGIVSNQQFTLRLLCVAANAPAVSGTRVVAYMLWHASVLWHACCGMHVMSWHRGSGWTGYVLEGSSLLHMVCGPSCYALGVYCTGGMSDFVLVCLSCGALLVNRTMCWNNGQRPIWVITSTSGALLSCLVAC